MRGLKDRLVEELNTGKLAWLLLETKKNAALTLCFGVNTLEVYYRGALAATVKPGGGYTFILDESHFHTPELKEEYAIFIRDKKAVSVYQRKFPVLMEAMDITAESHGLKIEFPQEVADTNPCILDANYPLALGISVMLTVVNGELLALRQVTGDLNEEMKSDTAFMAVDKGEIVESAKLIMANRVALGLMEEMPFGDTVELAFLCSPSNQATITGRVLCLPEGSFSLKDCT